MITNLVVWQLSSRPHGPHLVRMVFSSAELAAAAPLVSILYSDPRH
jgi:hypothetical protein